MVHISVCGMVTLQANNDIVRRMYRGITLGALTVFVLKEEQSNNNHPINTILPKIKGSIFISGLDDRQLRACEMGETFANQKLYNPTAIKRILQSVVADEVCTSKMLFTKSLQLLKSLKCICVHGFKHCQDDSPVHELQRQLYDVSLLFLRSKPYHVLPSNPHRYPEHEEGVRVKGFHIGSIMAAVRILQRHVVGWPGRHFAGSPVGTCPMDKFRMSVDHERGHIYYTSYLDDPSFFWQKRWRCC